MEREREKGRGTMSSAPAVRSGDRLLRKGRAGGGRALVVHVGSTSGDGVDAKKETEAEKGKKGRGQGNKSGVCS